jgi:hypothetical protein
MFLGIGGYASFLHNAQREQTPAIRLAPPLGTLVLATQRMRLCHMALGRIASELPWRHAEIDEQSGSMRLQSNSGDVR